jgi:hypothetical protein
VNYIADIAERIRHEVPQAIWPEGDTDLLFLMYAVLALAVREDVRAEDVHDTWSAWMTHGNPSHESIKPFAQLSPETQRADQPFVDAIRRVASQLP